jgi:predicted phosphodiesterase
VGHIHLRILSDLHYAEPASRIADLRFIRPLFDGPERFVLNGDSIDTRFLDQEPSMAEGREAFLRFIAPFAERLILITGNHDPDISPLHHLELASGRILITHGDVLFPSVAPWGWEAPHVLVAREKRLAEIEPADRDRLETQLAVCKHASYATRHLSPTAHAGPTSTRARLLHLASRVRRADKILTSWFHAPALAARLAAQHRAEAELVIFGHTHYPGVWRRDGRLVINTGAFTPPFAARVVDFVDDRVEVRRVVRRGDEFRVGDAVASFAPGRGLHTPFF